MSMREQPKNSQKSEDQLRCQSLIDSARDCAYDDPGTCLRLASEALTLSEHIGDEFLRIRSLQFISFGRWNLRQSSEAFDAASLALQLSVGLDDPLAISLSYLFVGFCLVEQGDLFGAYECFEFSRESAEDNDLLPKLKSVALLNLALVGEALKQFEPACEQLSRARDICSLHPDETDSLPIIVQLASVNVAHAFHLRQTGKHELAAQRAQAGLMVAEHAHCEALLKRSVAYQIDALEHVIGCLAILGRLKEAEKALADVRKLVSECRRRTCRAQYLNASAMVQLVRNRPERAGKLFAQSASYFERFGSQHSARIANENAYRAFEAANDIPNAFRHLKVSFGLVQQCHADACRRWSTLNNARSTLAHYRLERSILETRNEFLAVRARELEKDSLTDGLTGALNRRGLDAKLRLHSDSGDFCVVLLDVDHFKQINDQFGHNTGDQILRQIVEIVRSGLRQSEHVGRVGGEEFAVLLNTSDRESGGRVADRIRKSVERFDWSSIATDVKVTVSCGVEIHRRYADLIQTYERADRALYTAKRLGRNRVCLAELDRDAAA